MCIFLDESMDCDAFRGTSAKILHGKCFAFISGRFTEISVQSWRWWQR